MTPAFRLEVEGEDVTERVQRHLVELRLTLTSDTASDSLHLTLSDASGALDRPAAEREIRVSLGYLETGLHTLGAYYHTETDIELAPRRLVLRATAADFRRQSTFKAPRSRVWPATTTLGRMVGDIAANHGYTARVAPALAAEPLGHIDQTAESDLHLLRRIASRFDATLKAAGGRLILMPRGAGRSAVSGVALPSHIASPGSWAVLSGRIEYRGRPRYGSVVAGYYDVRAARVVHVTAGSGEPRFVIRDLLPSRAQALADAQARLARGRRQTAILSLSLVGDPTLVAEGRISTTGWGGSTDGTWSITRVIHTLSASGFRSQVSAEIVP